MSKVERAYLHTLRELGVDPDEPIQANLQFVRDAMRAAGAPDEIIEKVIGMQGKTRKEQYDPVLKPIQRAVEIDAETIHASWEGEVFVGGLPSQSRNAAVQKVDGGYLILVNEEMIQLLHQTAKVMVHSSHLLMVSEGDEVPMSFADRLGFVPSEWTKEYAIEAVADIYRCLRAGDITQARPHPIFGWQLEADFYDRLLNYAERFLVSHEYAHVIIGHCDDEERNGPHETARRRQAELDADKLAVRLMFATIDFSNDDPETYRDAAMRAAGIALAFLANWLADCCHDLQKGLTFDDDEMATHPHLQRRVQAVRNFIKDRYGPITTYMDVVTTWIWGMVLPTVGELTDSDELREMGADPLAIRFD